MGHLKYEGSYDASTAAAAKRFTWGIGLCKGGSSGSGSFCVGGMNGKTNNYYDKLTGVMWAHQWQGIDYLFQKTFRFWKLDNINANSVYWNLPKKCPVTPKEGSSGEKSMDQKVLILGHRI